MVSLLWFGLAIFIGVVYLFFPRQSVLMLGLTALYTSVFAAMGVNDLLNSALVFFSLGVVIFAVNQLFLKGKIKDEEA